MKKTFPRKALTSIDTQVFFPCRFATSDKLSTDINSGASLAVFFAFHLSRNKRASLSWISLIRGDDGMTVCLSFTPLEFDSMACSWPYLAVAFGFVSAKRNIFSSRRIKLSSFDMFAIPWVLCCAVEMFQL